MATIVKNGSSSSALTTTIYSTPDVARQAVPNQMNKSNSPPRQSALRSAREFAPKTPGSTPKTVSFDTANTSFSTPARLVDLSPVKPLYPTLERLQGASPVARQSQVSTAPHTPSSLSKETTAQSQTKSHALFASAPPLSRSSFAKRLRVNAVLLVVYWLTTRTQVYKLTSGHMVAIAPSLDTPLHLLESTLLLLLSYNIAESMFKLNSLSTLPVPQRITMPGAALSPLKYSSPKTRPSPVARAAPSSPGSPLRSPASPFRTGTPVQEYSTPSDISPLARSSIGKAAAAAAAARRGDESPLIRSFKARHGETGAIRSSLDRSERENILA